MSDPAVLWITAIWAARRGLTLLAMITFLAVAAYQLTIGGLGRIWEARATLGVEAPGEAGMVLPILRARLTSGNLARDLQLPAGVSVTIAGAAVLECVVTAPSAEAAISAANALTQALLDEQAQRDRDLAGHERARHARLEHEYARVTEDLQGARLAQRAMEERRLHAVDAAARAIAAAASTGKGAIMGVTPEERRLDWTERDLSAAVGVVDRLDQRRVVVLTALTPQMAPARLYVRLSRIDTAVAATRLPIRVWTSLWGGPVTTLLVGAGIVLLRRWWREASARGLPLGAGGAS